MVRRKQEEEAELRSRQVRRETVQEWLEASEPSLLVLERDAEVRIQS